MGVINATPDSFWAGSRHQDPEEAAAAARAMVAQGADLLDVGAASSRPGAPEVPVDLELRRLLPVLGAVRAAVDCPLSVDTTRSEVAEAALAAGADAVNDVSGLSDARLAPVVARARASLVLLAGGRVDPAVGVVPSISAEWDALIERARAEGMPAQSLILDPGFGFGKTPEQNLALVAALPALRARFGLPLCIGPSRKGTIARLLGPRPPADRRHGTAALVALCAAYGADVIRVHDVAEMAEVAVVADAVGVPHHGAGGPEAVPPAAGARPGVISVRGLRFEARHGVLPAEHSAPQPFLIDLDLELDLGGASRSDELTATLDYAAAAQVVAEVMGGPHRNLLERLAGEIAARLLAEFPMLRSGAVAIHKPEAPLGLAFQDVSVRLPFGRPRGRNG